MPEGLRMGNVDDLNLDFSDRNWSAGNNGRRNLAFEFKIHDESDGAESDGCESVDDLDLEDEYYFDQRLDFGLAGYVPSNVTNTGAKKGQSEGGDGDKNGVLEQNGEVTCETSEESKNETKSVLTIALEKLEVHARRNDREEIRKKLAMGGDDDYYDDNDDDDDITYKKPNLQSRLHSGLQICFMNESPCDTDSEGLSPRQHEIHDNLKSLSKDNEVDSDNNLRSVTDLNRLATAKADSVNNTSPPLLKTTMDGVTSENFHSRQEQLQQEAKMALAQAGSMAHMQLEIEKQTQKKSPMAEIVGIPGLGERRRKKLGVRKLQEMNLTSIQVLYNDLQTQIENLNEELVHLLMERDELHMEQDSMLVDIEDLTRRAEELAARKNYKDSKGNIKGKVSGR